LAAYRATGALLYVPKFLLLLANCYRNAGEPKVGLEYLEEAAGTIEGNQIRGAEADMHRTRGEFLSVVGDRGAAETSFLQALDVARRQNAKLLELQAASMVARLWRDHGKRTEARDLLGPIYHWFTEGFDAPDPKDTKALLAELT
jgi:tetratricopeptide (TPR) repeat protein